MCHDVDVTLIVTISEDAADHLESWVGARGGSVEPWDLVIGQYGCLRTGQDHQPLMEYIRAALADLVRKLAPNTGTP